MARPPVAKPAKTSKGPKKSKAKGRKIGRAKGKPSHALQPRRTAANKKRNLDHQAFLKTRRSAYKARVAAKKLAALAHTALVGPRVPRTSLQAAATASLMAFTNMGKTRPKEVVA